jgi:toxin ParE1/3/4
MTGLRLHPEARDEIDSATAYYEGARPGHGARFLASVERVFEHMVAAPSGGARWASTPIRTWPVRRFPFLLVYSIEHDHILVVAAAHTRRRPGYWLDRLDRR